MTGLDRIRSSTPYVELPLIGVEALVLAQVLALRIGVPILAVATELRTPEDYEAVRERVGPIGAGRPNEGLSREDPLAFSVLDVPAMTHLDPTSAPRGSQNPVPRAVFDFVSRIAGASASRAR